MRYNDAYAVRQRNIMRYAIRDAYVRMMDDDSEKRIGIIKRLCKGAKMGLERFKGQHPMISKLIGSIVLLYAVVDGAQKLKREKAIYDIQRLADKGNLFAIAASPFLPSKLKAILVTLFQAAKGLAMIWAASKLA